MRRLKPVRVNEPRDRWHPEVHVVRPSDVGGKDHMWEILEPDYRNGMRKDRKEGMNSASSEEHSDNPTYMEFVIPLGRRGGSHHGQRKGSHRRRSGSRRPYNAYRHHRRQRAPVVPFATWKALRHPGPGMDEHDYPINSARDRWHPERLVLEAPDVAGEDRMWGVLQPDWFEGEEDVYKSVRWPYNPYVQ